MGRKQNEDREEKNKDRGCIDGTGAVDDRAAVFLGNYHNMFLGILTLALFSLPKIVERKLRVSIPGGLQAIILIFIYSAEILGEINAFYVKIPMWDTMLHTTNGILMAAIGFAMIDIFNRSEKFSIKMSPYFVAFVAFCFSMTIGVLWEFYI